MAAQDPKDIFTKISDLDDRVRLARDMVRLKGELICKSQSSEDTFRLEASRIEGTARVVCVHKSGTSMPSPVPVAVIVSFSVGSDRYFLMTSLSNIGGGYFEVDFSKDIFHLQRRQSYRIRFPDNHKSTYEIGRLNSQPRTMTGGIWDISTGGVRLLFPHDRPLLTVDDVVEGVLNLGQRQPLSFKGQVRHVKFERDDILRQIVGVEFLEMTTVMENRLFAITMELHRELLTRW